MAGYRWVRLDVDYFTNPKILAVSLDAKMLHIASITYAAKHMTDGQIADRSLTVVGQMADISPRWVRRRAAELEQAKLWMPAPDGWYLHDFEIMNPQAMRVAVELERERWRERQRRSRQRRDGDVTP